MLYAVSPELFNRFPGYVRGLVVATHAINLEGPIDEVARMLKKTQEALRARTDLDGHPNMAAWRAARLASSAFGARHGSRHKYPSSIEAMVKRVLKGGELPYINTLAALGNMTSLKHLVPVGGHDVGVCAEPLWLGFADGTETFTAFGATEVEHPEPGEVVYLNGKTVLCRRWTWRQAEVTKLTRTTTHAAINVDGLPPVTRADVETICDELATQVRLFCAAQVECKMLAKDSPVIEV
jgi:DNA/RNA-binding domain of Phe-tRNA-synthetase-like protein